jgi:hypothetical protein
VTRTVLVRAYRALALSRRLRRAGPRRVPPSDLWSLVRGLALRPTELRLRAAFRDTGQPLAFVIGAPRSGSTLISQLAARCTDAAYVANGMARYWLTPLVGWDRLLARGPLDRLRVPLASTLGATSGAESPHEFGYFFRTWMDLEASDELDEAAIQRCDWRELRGALEGVAGRFRAPMVVKNLNAVSFQVAAFAAAMPQSTFVHVTRERDATVASILAARRRSTGDETTWWSSRPRAYRDWAGLPAREQVERQVDAIRDAVARDLARLPPARRLEIALEDTRADPRGALERLAGFLGVEARIERLAVEAVLPA